MSARKGDGALKGKVALVTGAAGTMGRNIAKSLLEEGASVMIADFNLEKATSTAKELSAECAAGGGSAVAGFVDVTDEASVVKLFGSLQEDLKRCDILVNSAGIMLPPTPTENVTAAAFNRLMGVNVTGAFLCAREAFKLMKKQEDGGRVINIGSIAAKSTRPDAVAYTTSKFAISGLTQSLALDGRAHKIAVGIVHPGNVLSDLITPEEVAQRRAQGEDFMDPKVVADTVLSICLLPSNTTVLELTVMPTVQPLIGRG